MELTRRDAIAALAALGGAGVGYGAYRRSQASDAAAVADDETVKTTLVAAADVLYPSEVEGIEPFVRAFLEGRLVGADRADRPLDGADDDQSAVDPPSATDGGLHEAVTTLTTLSEEWHDRPFASLRPTTRDRLLREIGADTAEEAPDGTIAERVRYYVVNELLLALYTSPTGGELLGIENPQGHPGGIDSYQRGPQ
jgi:hypothetical protein